MSTGMEDKGLGGAITVRIACSGCGNSIHYGSSMVCLTERRRNCVSCLGPVLSYLGAWIPYLP